LISTHLKEEGLIDEIINEPLGGIHRDPDKAKQLLKNALIQQLQVVSKITIDKILQTRQEKLLGFGKFQE